MVARPRSQVALMSMVPKERSDPWDPWAGRLMAYFCRAWPRPWKTQPKSARKTGFSDVDAHQRRAAIGRRTQHLVEPDVWIPTERPQQREPVSEQAIGEFGRK